MRWVILYAEGARAFQDDDQDRESATGLPSIPGSPRPSPATSTPAVLSFMLLYAASSEDVRGA
jgi:hypothetical protein